jgi:hypothetical protein
MLPIRSLRLRSFDTATLNRTSGSPGEIFYDNTLKTLRISNGAGQAVSTLSLGASDRLINGTKSLVLGTNGTLTLQGDIRSEGNINIDINLSDSTIRRWQFGEDGDLTLPAGGDVKNSIGQGIFALLTNYVTGADLGSTLNSYVLQNTGATGNIFTNLIDSADSSAITVTPATIFSSDVTVENDFRVNGSRVIRVTDLKALVAASANFADFQTRVAALLNN